MITMHFYHDLHVPKRIAPSTGQINGSKFPDYYKTRPRSSMVLQISWHIMIKRTTMGMMLITNSDTFSHEIMFLRSHIILMITNEISIFGNLEVNKSNTSTFISTR